MQIRLWLGAGGPGGDEEITVESTVAVDTTDPRWPARLQDELAARAHEAAWHLARELAPGPATTPRFRPLASILAQVEPACPTAGHSAATVPTAAGPETLH